MSEPKLLSVSDRLAVSPAEAARLVGIGRTKIYEAISAGELKSLKIGSRRLVAIEALRDWLRTHEVTSRLASPSGADDMGHLLASNTAEAPHAR